MTIVSVAMGHALMALGQDDSLTVLSEGKKWRVSVQFTQSAEQQSFYLFSVDKDTLINGKSVKKIICVAEDNSDNYTPQSFYAMEDNGVLTGLCKYPDSSTSSGYVWYEEPILDMTVKDDAVFSGLRVVGIDYITALGQSRRRIILDLAQPFDIGQIYWVEGIGASNSFGWIFRWVPKPIGSGAMRSYSVEGAYLIAVEDVFDGDNLIFTKGDFKRDTGIGLNREEPESNYDTYDLYGRRIMNPVKGSIYIRNGQKIIER